MTLKEGDRVGLRSIGAGYRVKWVGEGVVVLETEDGLGQFLTTVNNLDLKPFPQNPRTNKQWQSES
jgi:hypothetical protein